MEEWVIFAKKSDIDQYIDSITEGMADKTNLTEEMVGKWTVRPSLADKLADKLVDILMFMADKGEITTDIVVSKLGYTATTAKRYMRQLTEFGYIEARGGNKNRSYSIRTMVSRSDKANL